MDDIMDLLNEIDSTSTPGIRDEVYVPDEVPVSDGSWNFCQEIGPRLAKKAGVDLEWLGFPTANLGDMEYIVRDILVPKGQRAVLTAIQIDDGLRAAATNEIKQINKEPGQNIYMIGWTHGHGGLEPFHSDEYQGDPEKGDVFNFRKILNTVTLNTQLPVRVPFSLFNSTPTHELKDGNVIVTGKDVIDALLSYDIPTENLEDMLGRHNIVAQPGNFSVEDFVLDVLRSINVHAKETKYIGFGYSLVWNNLNVEPYAEIGVIEETITTGRKTILEPKVVKVKKVKVTNDVSYTTRQIDKIIDDRIIYPKYQRGTTARLVRGKQTYGAEDYYSEQFLAGTGGHINFPPHQRFHGPNQFGQAGIYSPRVKRVKKENRGEYNPTELTKSFVYKCMGYLSMHAASECCYSEFLGGVVDKLSETTRPYVKRPKTSLTEVIRSRPFKQDEKEINAPDIMPYQVRFAAEGIREGLGINNDNPLTTKQLNTNKQVMFMLEFVEAPTVRQMNKVLEKYCTGYL